MTRTKTITVKELKELIENVDDNAEVYIRCAGWEYTVLGVEKQLNDLIIVDNDEIFRY